MTILVNEQVNSAPRILSAIGGGLITITMGEGDPDAMLVEARELARALGGR